MKPDQALFFLAGAAAKTHVVNYGPDGLLVGQTCAAVILDGPKVAGWDDSKCTCGATDHNRQVERAVEALSALLVHAQPKSLIIMPT